MKLMYIFVALMLYSWAHGQVVVSLPAFATENDSIVIQFDATAGDAGLMGYGGDDVYAHTGVLTNYSNGAWTHVIAEWNENIPKAKLNRITTDLYELVIGLPRDYYALTDPDEMILQLAFVFRNADASLTGRDTGGADIFLDLFEPGLTIIALEPTINLQFLDPLRTPLFSNPNDTVTIRTTSAQIGTELNRFILAVNDTQVAEVYDDTLIYSFIGEDHSDGINLVTIVAEDTSNYGDTLSFFIMVNPAVKAAVLPEGKIDGINYENDVSVTLSLFAPYKDFVYVLGDFNDWQVDTSYYMKKHEVNADSVHWWLTISGLDPGTEYGFQYLVDGDLRIADPYAAKLLDPDDDIFIGPELYPDLIPYPQGKTAEMVSVLQTDQVPFDWQYSETFQRKPQHELIIYELLVRDFVANHDYATLIDTLDYLQNLGINAIELMPINEFTGNINWGYDPSFYFAPDKYYGPAEDLKRFIDECHNRGIAVITDLVLNHSSGESPFVQLYLDYYGGAEVDFTLIMKEPNPWFNRESPNQVFRWGADFNHESPATKKLVNRVTHYWLTEFKVDGFRFDFTKGFTNTPGDGGAFDQARIDILKDMADKIWETDSAAYVILEHFADNAEEIIISDYGMMIWGNTNYNYNEATMGYNEDNKSDFSWGFYKTRGWNQPNLVTYMESHDEERLMFKNLEHGNSSGNYDVQELAVALNRIKLAAAFFFTLPGPKMIWQFGELGYDFSIDYNGRTGEKPIRWDYFNEYERQNLYKTFAALLKLRNENELFRSIGTSVDLSLNPAQKRIRLAFFNLSAIILGNFDVIAAEIIPQFYSTGTWYDYFSGDSIEVTNINEPIYLEPGQFYIYTSKKLETPEPGIIGGVEEESRTIIRDYALQNNFPNPFNPSTTIRYQLPKAGKVTLDIYTIGGEKITRLVDGFKNVGTYQIQWQGETVEGFQVASGIYIYTLRAADFRASKKMVLLR